MKTEQEILSIIEKSKRWVKYNFCDKIGKQYIEGFVDGLEYLKKELLNQKNSTNCTDCCLCKYDINKCHWYCIYKGFPITISFGQKPENYIPDWCPLEDINKK